MKTQKHQWTERLIVITLCIGALLLLQKTDVLPSFRDLFRPKPVVIDQTPVLIKEIRSIAQVVTATLYSEVVVDSAERTGISGIVETINATAKAPILPRADKRLVLVVKGRVLAGTDLSNLTEKNIRIAGDTVWLHLPPPKILDVITNPTDMETFEERGFWTPQAVAAVKEKAKVKMVKAAQEQKILEKAGSKTRAVLEDFLAAAGYKVVFIGPGDQLDY